MSNDFEVASLSNATRTLLYCFKIGMYSSGKEVPSKAIPVIKFETAHALAQSSTNIALSKLPQTILILVHFR